MLNAATKSGGSEFHGGVFEFLRNDVFDAADYFVKQKQELNRHQFGGTLGGPLDRGQDVLLRELRRDPREPGAARQPDRGVRPR